MRSRVIDFHTHFGNYDGDKVVDRKKIYSSMQEAGIGYSVVFPFSGDLRPEELLEESYRVRDQTKGEEGLLPFLRFHPDMIGASELSEIINDFYGVKLHPRDEDFDPLKRRYKEIFKVLEISEKPVLFHTRKENNKYSDPDRVLKLSKRFPQMRLVLGHFACLSPYVIKKMEKWKKKGKKKHVYLETSAMGATPYSIEHYVGKKIGFDKIVFGSDLPYADQLIEKLNVDRSKIKVENKEKILYENARQLLKLHEQSHHDKSFYL